ncbi:gamma-glutamyl hydrolase A [Drosophila ficusphila]|uniref:gamma-glutamyl hydrolase A n=1 Tax=Drosophila ficusphila TaxID=30025 RepID=UPI0007E761E5|nr:gamma-glutamyl hydrolase A [Drosophila ficusphila]XP_017043414.1 gamma-glutamyl hydrolase A [Drosophila ficusphila]
MEKLSKSLLIFVGFLLTSAAAISSPIIGVLTQEVYTDGLISRHFDNKTSYIAASYVKYLEGAGARVVPIWIGRNRSYYEDLMHKINGVLLPGGATWFNQTNGYADAGEHLIQLAIEQNDQGIFMPVWGTCLGMELMVYKLANGTEHRISCQGKGIALPMEFKEDFNKSRLFASISDDVVAAMIKENVTYHWHQYCYTEKDFERDLLNETWRVISLNHDWDGNEFISTMEHIKYPFYGVQFHPEKPLYEFTKTSIPHTEAAVLSGQFFADFFVNEARKSNQSFTNATEQARTLIYNYKPEYTSILGSSYIQQYLFTNDEMEIPDIPDEGGDDGDGEGGNSGGYIPIIVPGDGSSTINPIFSFLIPSFLIVSINMLF